MYYIQVLCVYANKFVYVCICEVCDVRAHTSKNCLMVNRLYSRFLARIPELKRGSSVTFHKLVVKAVRLYRDCFARLSLRHCAYNETLFESTGVSQGDLQGPLCHERLSNAPSHWLLPSRCKRLLEGW